MNQLKRVFIGAEFIERYNKVLPESKGNAVIQEITKCLSKGKKMVIFLKF